MLVRYLRFLAPLALTAAFGCGDIGRVVLDVQFTSDRLEQQTRSLEVVVRQSVMGANGCDNLWSTVPTGLAEDTEYVLYPNRVPVRASPVDLAQYPVLTMLVYAHSATVALDAAEPIGGGCIEEAVDPNESREFSVVLDDAP